MMLIEPWISSDAATTGIVVISGRDAYFAELADDA